MIEFGEINSLGIALVFDLRKTTDLRIQITEWGNGAWRDVSITRKERNAEACSGDVEVSETEMSRILRPCRSALSISKESSFRDLFL